jgi:5-methylcytosine-specific restriction protein A
MALTKNQRDALETSALKTFVGKIESLADGFLIQTDKGPVAAVYWDGTREGNDVEISVAESRLTDHYDLVTVQAWMRSVMKRWPSGCNTHPIGRDWPSIGLKAGNIDEFLKGCKALRIGWLPEAELADLRASISALSPQEAAEALLRAELEALRPTRRRAVIDLVSQAGINTKPWYERKDGTDAATPRSNPAYCYNWAFGGGAEPSLACIWHASIAIDNQYIVMRGNLRELSIRLERIATDPKESEKRRERARPQSSRARQLDELIAGASAAHKPMRVVINEGSMADESKLGEEVSIVRVRHLDPLPWSVLHYDKATGQFELQRKANSKSGRHVESAAQPPRPLYADQHDLAGSDTPERVTVVGTAIKRDPVVRQLVLERAEGHCELCNQPGFMLPDGRHYVETHHVELLANGGPDRVWNVIALCPTHHREVHYGTERVRLQEQMTQLLWKFYPEGTPERLSEAAADLSDKPGGAPEALRLPMSSEV